MFRVMEELEAMPELQRIQRIQLQQSSYFIFQRNADELRKILNFHSDVEENMALWDVNNRDPLSFLQLEVGRLLHNFASSAAGLIDVTRRFYEKYDVNEFPDYLTRVDSEFKTNPLSRFVKDLRNYAVHVEVPPISSELSGIGINSTLQSLIVLPGELLLAKYEWSKPAKQYIADCNNRIVLNSVVEDYFEKVSRFYDWFYKRLNEVHKEDISRVTAKQEELKRAYVPHPADFEELE